MTHSSIAMLINGLAIMIATNIAYMCALVLICMPRTLVLFVQKDFKKSTKLTFTFDYSKLEILYIYIIHAVEL